MKDSHNLIKKLPHVSNFLPWIIWLLAVFFYGYQFMQGLVSVYIPSIAHDLNLEPTAIGMLGGSFYYAYAIMQLPVGAITDRFGARYPALTGLALLILGTFIMSEIHSLMLGVAARFLMGLGGAFAFICTMQLIIVWFPRERFAGLAGLTNFMGYIGASLGGIPINYLCQQYGWRTTILLTGFLGIAIFVGMFFFVKKRDGETISIPALQPKKSAIKSLLVIMKIPINWVNGLYCTLTVGPTTAFAGLYGVKFLTSSYGVTSTVAASAITAVFLGVAIGSPVTGWVSDYLGKRRLLLVGSALLGSAITLALIILHHLPVWAIQSLCFAFGFMQSVHVLCFANAKDDNPSHAASAIAFINMALILGGAVLQPLIGLLQVHLGDWLHLVNRQTFEVSSLEYALLIIPCCQLIAALIAFFSARDNVAS
jgi:MFS family permease